MKINHSGILSQNCMMPMYHFPTHLISESMLRQVMKIKLGGKQTILRQSVMLLSGNQLCSKTLLSPFILTDSPKYRL